MSFLTRTDPQREVLYKAEEAIYKRDFNTAQRKKLAAAGHALPDGSYPIESQADLHPAAVLARSGHGDTAAAKALIARRAKELGASNPLDDEKGSKMEKAEVDIVVPIWKSEIEGKVWGVVLEPELPDSQQDIISKEEIAAACHDFMTARRADAHHSGEIVKADLIENFCAPCDFTLAGNPVREGSWVQGWQVHDSEVKDEIAKGELTGLSLHGLGVREAV